MDDPREVGYRVHIQFSYTYVIYACAKLSDCCSVHEPLILASDGSVVSLQKTAVAVVASGMIFLKTVVAVVMRLC